MRLLTTALLSFALLSPVQADWDDNLRVVDGDTFILFVGRPHEQVIRIANIDAPETRTAKCEEERQLGLKAARRLDELLRTEKDWLVMDPGDPTDGRKKDRYGRTLAVVYVKGQDVGQILIDEGLARPWKGRREPWCE